MQQLARSDLYASDERGTGMMELSRSQAGRDWLRTTNYREIRVFYYSWKRYSTSYRFPKTI